MPARPKIKRSGGDPRIAQVASLKNDPLSFVRWCWPWGTGELKHEPGPEIWQRQFLETLGEECRKRNFDGHTPVDPIRMAVASGHDIGKTALVNWILIWAMSTRPGCQGTVTANTLPQLQQKTWAQLSKWLRMSMVRDWFDYANTRGNMSLRVKTDPNEWFSNAFTCKEDNSEAFQGQHSPNSTSLYIFDEASAIPDPIWNAAEGGLLDGEPMIFAFGNPTRNTGRFCDLFGKFKHRWILKQIDSRTVSRSNKKLLEEWVQDWGEDSDWVRIRVKGEFPRLGVSQFIPLDVIEAAMGNVLDPRVYLGMPKLLGVDVAREGDDMSVIVRRQGRMCFAPKKLRLPDLMLLASYVAEEIREWQPDAVFVDANGLGIGVVDRLRQLGHEVIPVNASYAPTKEGYANMRAQMWGDMRKWLKEGASIPNDDELKNQLVAQEYGFSKGDLIQLVSKRDMKSEGLPSPDCGDALSFTFAHEVWREDALDAFKRVVQDNTEDYDFMESFRQYTPFN